MLTDDLPAKIRYTVTLQMKGQDTNLNLPLDALDFADAAQIADLAYSDKFRVVGIKETITRQPKGK